MTGYTGIISRWLLGALGSLLLIGILAVGGGNAQAAVMTFSGIPDNCPAFPVVPYSEDGITATTTGNALSSFAGGAGVHLDPSGSSCARSVQFTTGGVFDAVSADISPIGNGRGEFSDYCADEGNCFSPTGEFLWSPYDNLLWQGFVGGTLVASDRLWMGTTDFTYVFDEAFRAIDMLLVRILNPDLDAIGGVCFDSPCSHLDLISVTLSLPSMPDPSVIPLPAPIWLLLSALGAFGLIGRSRRQSWRGKAS